MVSQETMLRLCDTKNDNDEHKESFDEVVFLSAPMDVPSDKEYLETLLLKKQAPKPAIKQVKPQDDPPMIGGEAPSNEAEVAEIKPLPAKKAAPKPKPAAKKAAPKKKATPKANK